VILKRLLGFRIEVSWVRSFMSMWSLDRLLGMRLRRSRDSPIIRRKCTTTRYVVSLGTYA
jgi:hypothetical protein